MRTERDANAALAAHAETLAAQAAALAAERAKWAAKLGPRRKPAQPRRASVDKFGLYAVCGIAFLHAGFLFLALA